VTSVTSERVSYERRGKTKGSEPMDTQRLRKLANRVLSGAEKQAWPETDSPRQLAMLALDAAQELEQQAPLQETAPTCAFCGLAIAEDPYLIKAWTNGAREHYHSACYWQSHELIFRRRQTS
jgi:hypothetical protein